MKSNSPFDTGNWSDVNGLPGQQDMLNFLEHLSSENPDRCFTRRELMDEVAREFQIPPSAQEAEGPESTTAGYYTRLTYLITDAVYGVRRADGHAFLKRIAPSCYQHVSGNGVVSSAFKDKKVRKSKVKEATASANILRGLNWDKERTFIELLGTCDWTEAEIELAVDTAFAN